MTVVSACYEHTTPGIWYQESHQQFVSRRLEKQWPRRPVFGSVTGRYSIVNSVLFVMTTVLGVGGDVVPAGWGERAQPAIVQAGGCQSCGSSAAHGKHSASNACCGASERVGFLDRIKARLGSNSGGCGCASKVTAPCGCGVERYSAPNLWDKLRARCGKKSSDCCNPCSNPTINTIAPSPTSGTGSAPAKAVTPEEMPKTIPDPIKTTPKGEGNSGTTSIPPIPPQVIPLTKPLGPVNTVPVRNSGPSR